TLRLTQPDLPHTADLEPDRTDYHSKDQHQWVFHKLRSHRDSSRTCTQPVLDGRIQRLLPDSNQRIRLRQGPRLSDRSLHGVAAAADRLVRAGQRPSNYWKSRKIITGRSVLHFQVHGG